MYLHLLKDAFHGWREDHVPRLAAALSYYTLFSLAPLFLIVVSLASLFFGETQIRSHIISQVSALIGSQGAVAIAGIIQRDPPLSQNIYLSTLGLIFIFLGATGVFGSLKSSLDFIWRVQPPKERSILSFIEHNFLPFTMVLGTGFLLLVSLILSTLIAIISNYLSGIIPFPLLIFESLNSGVTFIVITLLFALIYKILPDTKLKWDDVWSGAIVASILFTLGKFIIGFYIGNSNMLSAYGAASSVLVILIWVYYSAQILFYGAEYTKAYATQFGSLRKESKNHEISYFARIFGYFIDGLVKGIKKNLRI